MLELNLSSHRLPHQEDLLQLQTVQLVELVVLDFLVAMHLLQDLRRQVVVVEQERQEVASMVAQVLIQIFLVTQLCMDQVVQEEMEVVLEPFNLAAQVVQLSQLQIEAVEVQISAPGGMLVLMVL
jgi:hypothetical protein